jgi:hypothetical protein
MASEAQKRANAKYQKNNVKQIITRFYPGDMELYEWVKSQPGMGEYVRGLIREDMERRRPNPAP